MAKKLGNRQKEAWVTLLLAHGALTKEIDRRMAEAGLPSMEVYDVLLHLELAGGQMRMSELAEKALFSRSGITRLVDRLEREGLVERCPCPGDRRVIHARITKEGSALRHASWPPYRDALAELFGSRISDSEAQCISDVLSRFVTELCGTNKALKKSAAASK